jgi:hypothetical protein
VIDMIDEIAFLQAQTGRGADFESALAHAVPTIAQAPGLQEE